MANTKEADKIINYAPEIMREMLKSVYSYNSSFLLTKEQENLLNCILFAISLVDRKYFANHEQAYEDNALSIGSGQTISQPSTVARMLILAEISAGDNVLEIGAGSGWNASLLGFLAYPGKVRSIDRIYSLIKQASNNISDFKGFLKQKKPSEYQKFSKITLASENIFELKGKTKYDKIIITAGINDKKTGKKIDKIAKEMLNQKGILICPYTSGPIIIYKKEGKLKKFTTKEHYVFVPLLEGIEK